MLQLAFGSKVAQLVTQFRRNDSNTRAGSSQQLNLAGGYTSATNDDYRPLLQLKENGQVVHAIGLICEAGVVSEAGASQACAAT